jgi:hypothetical protein
VEEKGEGVGATQGGLSTSDWPDKMELQTQIPKAKACNPQSSINHLNYDDLKAGWTQSSAKLVFSEWTSPRNAEITHKA